MDIVSDLPRRAFTRTAKLATLPVGLAGRTALGLGKRIGGRPAELVATEIQQRTAEQIFRVLGELKGGAMKFGQALSVFEAALPEEVAGPYRATLTRLQDAAPPMPARAVHAVLARQLGADWRDLFDVFEDKPSAAASIGQVLVTEWLEGVPLAEVISRGSDEERNRAGQLLARFLFAGPARTGLLHADPHPGNFRLLVDEGPAEGWRLGVLDFGTVDRLS